MELLQLLQRTTFKNIPWTIKTASEEQVHGPGCNTSLHLWTCFQFGRPSVKPWQVWSELRGLLFLWVWDLTPHIRSCAAALIQMLICCCGPWKRSGHEIFSRRRLASHLQFWGSFLELNSEQKKPLGSHLQLSNGTFRPWLWPGRLRIFIDMSEDDGTDQELNLLLVVWCFLAGRNIKLLLLLLFYEFQWITTWRADYFLKQLLLIRFSEL